MRSLEKRHHIRMILTIIVVGFMLATVTFIWCCSLQSEQASSAKSDNALVVMEPCLESFFGQGNVTEHLVRKTAHFLEFGALGCELALLAVVRGRPRVQTVLNGLFAGLAAAVTDEALQLVSGRGAMVLDVLLDFSGIAAGIFVILCLYAVCAFFRNRRR